MSHRATQLGDKNAFSHYSNKNFTIETSTTVYCRCLTNDMGSDIKEQMRMRNKVKNRSNSYLLFDGSGY
jgi:hypothetical protein